MKRALYILPLLPLFAFLLYRSSVRQDLGWIDSISGSRKDQTVRRLGPTSAPVIPDSPLAQRYRKLGLQWQPDWRNVKGTYVDLFGRHVGHEHGWPAPEIYTLATTEVLQERFLNASTDEEVRQFFRVMTTGTEAEKKAAVEAACDKALARASSTRPAR
jgi:hypothetical protein